MLEPRDKFAIVLGFAAFCLVLGGYYVWRSRPAVVAIHVADPMENLTSCRFIADLSTKIEPSNRFESAQSHNTQLLDAEQRLIQQAAAADADTVAFSTSPLTLTAKAFRCDDAH